MARSRLTGMKSTRRVIRTIPEVMKAEMRHVLEDAGPKIARQMQARAPRKTGALQAGIKWKVLPKTLKLQIGLLGTKAGRSKLFYGRILDLGRKPGVGRDGRRVGGITAKHFVTGSYPDLRSALRTGLKGVWNRVLSKAAKGAGNE